MFRNNLSQDEVVLSNLVQLDEAYFKDAGLIPGKQVGSKKLAWRILNTTDIQRHHAIYFLQQHIASETQLNTMELRSTGTLISGGR